MRDVMRVPVIGLAISLLWIPVAAAGAESAGTQPGVTTRAEQLPPTRRVRVTGLSSGFWVPDGYWVHCPAEVWLREGDWFDSPGSRYCYGGEAELSFRESADGRRTWLVTKKGRRLVWLDARGPEGRRLLKGTPPADLTTLHNIRLDVPPQQVAEKLRHVNWPGLYLEIDHDGPLADLDWTGCPVRHLRLYDTDVANLRPLAVLKHLKTLVLDDSNIDDLTPLAKLTGLEDFSVSRCSEVSDLTPLVGLPKLRILWVDECPRIKDLKPLGRLLATNRFELLALPTSVDDAWLRRVQPVLGGQRGLRVLIIGYGAKLTDLKPLAGLEGLKSLDLKGCIRVKDIAPVATLKGLRSVELKYTNIADLRPLTGLRELRHVDLTSCDELKDLTPIMGLRHLEFLSLMGCDSVEDLAPVEKLLRTNQLKALRLPTTVTDGWMLKASAALARQDLLKELRLPLCRQLTHLAPIQKLTELTILDLTGCESVTDLGPVKGLTKLRYLNISGCAAVEDLAPLAGLDQLRDLNAYRCEKARHVRALAGLKRLEQLNLGRCAAVTDLDALTKVVRDNPLKELSVPPAVTEAWLRKAAPHLDRLEELTIFGCRGVNDLSSLSELKRVHTLHVECPWTDDLATLPVLPALRELGLYGAVKLTDLTRLQAQPKLRSLTLLLAVRLVDLKPLGKLEHLRDLSLAACESVSDLRGLGDVKNLRTLRLRASKAVFGFSLRHLRHAAKLRWLEVRDCPNITAADLDALKKQNPNLRVLGP